MSCAITADAENVSTQVQPYFGKKTKCATHEPLLMNKGSGLVLNDCANVATVHCGGRETFNVLTILILFTPCVSC